jgi:hypothetical protein
MPQYMGFTQRAISMIAAELAVTSKALTPEEISNLVGLPYDRAYRIGDRGAAAP